MGNYIPIGEKPKKELKGRTKSDPNQILYDFQLEALEQMFSGCILNGGTGSGKSITSLFYYMKTQGGWKDMNHWTPMKNPKDLYIITTAKKRNDMEWEGELAHIMMSTIPELNKHYKNKVIVDSWNNIKKYQEVEGASFILDEDKITGNGAWVKAFLKIAKHNEWIVLSASPGDVWTDYIPVFVANGFYKNRTAFLSEHAVYSRYCTNFPKIERFVGTKKLEFYRDQIQIDMEFDRHTTQNHSDIPCEYDIRLYKDTMKNRWDPYKNEPIEQTASLAYILRKIVNSDESRVVALLEILEKTDRAIIFYSYDYELEILRNLFMDCDETSCNPLNEFEFAEYNGHIHDPLPKGKKWVYALNYSSGAEAFNVTTCDTIIFFSQTYSYKTLKQAIGRIDRLNTPYDQLYYYHFKSKASIDLAISKALKQKKDFNERKFLSWD